MRAFPDVVRIEPAGVCNFKCKHCPIGREGGHRVILSFQKFVEYFEMLPFVPRVLVLYHGGEPLLNKHLEDMILYAKHRGVQKVVFNTNASMITDKRDLSLVDELRVSFDGDSPEENNFIRTNSDFNVHALEVKKLSQSAASPKAIKIYNVRYFGNGVAQYLLDYFNDCKNITFQGVKIRNWARLDRTPEEQPRSLVNHCTNLFETFTILSNGDVPMCCEDLQADDVIGNVNQNSVIELWNKMEERRQAFAERNYPKLCQSCWVVTGVK